MKLKQEYGQLKNIFRFLYFGFHLNWTIIDLVQNQLTLCFISGHGSCFPASPLVSTTCTSIRLLWKISLKFLLSCAAKRQSYLFTFCRNWCRRTHERPFFSFFFIHRVTNLYSLHTSLYKFNFIWIFHQFSKISRPIYTMLRNTLKCQLSNHSNVLNKHCLLRYVGKQRVYRVPKTEFNFCNENKIEQ